MVSSAAALILLVFKQLGMSFTYNGNNSGPRVEPWGQQQARSVMLWEEMVRLCIRVGCGHQTWTYVDKISVELVDSIFSVSVGISTAKHS